MKFQVTMKGPDTLYDAITDALENEYKDLPEDEAEAAREVRREKLQAIADTWFEYGEYLTVEIDTDAKTCVVVPVGEES